MKFQMQSPTLSEWVIKSMRYAPCPSCHVVYTNEQDELKAELEALEQEELDDRLAGAERAPIHAPTSPVGVTSGRERMSPVIMMTDLEGVAQRAEEDDEEAQLRQLQAELAM